MITACRQAGLLPCRQKFPPLSKCRPLKAAYYLAIGRTGGARVRKKFGQLLDCLGDTRKTSLGLDCTDLGTLVNSDSWSAWRSGGRQLSVGRMTAISGSDLAAGPAERQELVNGEKAAVKEVQVTIDRSRYVKKIVVQALRVPKGDCHQMVKKLNKFKAEYPKIRNVVVEEGRPDTRLILLSNEISGPDLAELPEALAAELKANSDVEITQHEIILDYDCYTADQVLREVLPPGAEVPSSFETIGHVAHVNLRDELLPYKKVIGEVLLEKNFPRIRTILNKVGTIENEFRVPTFEVLAGDPSTVTEVKQHNARFQLDYAQVYWNSRLEYEHMRLVEQFKRDDVICDMFAGIGPFAIPAALKGCAIYANDLNPQSTHYLAVNCKLNKVSHRVWLSTLDAREFVRSLVRPSEPRAPQETPAPASGDRLISRLDKPVDTETASSLLLDRGNPESVEIRTETDGNSMEASVSARDFAGSERVNDSLHGAIGEAHMVTQERSSRGESNIRTEGKIEGEVRDGRGNPGWAQTPSSSGRGQQEGAKAPLGGAGKLAKGGKPPPLRPPKEAVPERPQRIDHVVMNLPASGIEFLDVFNGLFDQVSWKAPLPRIHCYCFARAFETDTDVIRRAEEALGGAIPEPVVWNVRDVAPNKTMLCVTFTLPAAVGFKTDSTRDESSSQTARPNGGSSSGLSLVEPHAASKKSRVH